MNSKLKKSALLAIILFSVTATFAQGNTSRRDYYALPVDFQAYLAGNVGEIRATHFHSGIDIKGGGRTGAPILAAADGYVSRVGVSPTGYGLVLYVTHRNGETTIYGHLDSFKKEIARWVRSNQYGTKSFRVNLYPTRDQFQVKKGEQIGSLGNSGSSGGPHLHFEIRNSHNQPINIMRERIFDIADNIRPTLYSVTLYECDTINGTPIFSRTKTLAALKTHSNNYTLTDSVFYTSKPHYFVYDVIDYKNGVSNTMGIYSLEQSVDSITNFSFAIDRISFGTTKYINSMVQYAQNRATRTHVLRAYVSANNALSMYKNIKERGVMQAPKAGHSRNITTTLEDDNGNTSSVSFKVATDSLGLNIHSAPSTTDTTHTTITTIHKSVPWNYSFTHSDSLFSATFPTRALYDTDLIEFSVDTLAGIYTIGNPSIPLHKPITITLKIDSIAPALRNRVLVELIDNKSVTRASYVKGNGKGNGKLSAKVSSLGRYRVVYDTIPPKITPLRAEDSELRFRVTDNLSGIRTYRLLIDGKWELLEWDPKRSLMVHRYKKSATPKQHNLKVTLSDYCGNRVISNTKATY